MLLWAASAGNAGASWIMLVAVFVYVLHHFSASSLAIVELVGTLPALLCMPFAGAITDRHDVRRLALGSMMVQALSLLGVLAVALSPALTAGREGALWRFLCPRSPRSPQKTHNSAPPGAVRPAPAKVARARRSTARGSARVSGETREATRGDDRVVVEVAGGVTVYPARGATWQTLGGLHIMAS
jgi:hypothetical protein